MPDSEATNPGTPIIDQNGPGWPATRRTLDRLDFAPAAATANQGRLAGAAATTLQYLGENPSCLGLKETPVWYATVLL